MESSPRSGHRAPRLVIVAALAAVTMTGCATIDTSTSLAEKDRFERLNRASYRVHNGIDRIFIKPVARGYDALPDKLQNRVANFFDNLRGPVDMSNNLLQGKFRRGFSSLGRLIVNSTIGLGGLFDPAAKMGMPRYEEDFGQTFATWGIPSGPYLFVPIVGPSTVRDMFGKIFDWQIDPVSQNDDTSTRNTLVIAREIEKRSEYLSDSTEGILNRSFDEYGTVLSQYSQIREAQILDRTRPIGLLDLDD